MDMASFIATFFEESREGLDQMETGLLALDAGNDDPELIHVIFRAAHSLKGGSATFGFTAVTELTHVMETLLDQVREGQRTANTDTILILLESVDALRGMMAALQGDEEMDANHHVDLVTRLTALLDSSETSPVLPLGGAEEAEAQPSSGWKIWFQPRLHLLKTGNDPARIFKELSYLGDLSVEVETDRLPALVDLEPDECHLAWSLTLRSSGGEIERAAVEEIFEWVEDDCDLAIQPLNPEVEEASEVTAEAAGDAASEAAHAEQDEGDDESPAPAAKEHVHAGPKPQTKVTVETRSIRVDTNKIDTLMNMVGQLVITQSMLSQMGAQPDGVDLEVLRDGLSQLERHTRALQESVMRIRMLPIGFSFNRFPRMVHDISHRLGKQVDLVISGEQTELDKTVMERIGDPLVHLVRNALDHGIESPEDREAAGKAPVGRLHLNAFHQSGHIVIEVSDDGKGIDTERILAKARERGLVGAEETLQRQQILELIFHPGFSTKDEVSDLSGRGVGMDVVRSNIKALGGTIEVRSRLGEGSTFSVRLPLTLAIIDGQLVQSGGQTYIIPLTSIIESIRIEPQHICTLAGQTELYKLRGAHLPIMRLRHLFGHGAGLSDQPGDLSTSILVVVEADGQRAALLVDELLGQQQIVIKSLEQNYGAIEGISGATILGSGHVALILDVAGLCDLSTRRGPARPSSLWSAL